MNDYCSSYATVFPGDTFERTGALLKKNVFIVLFANMLYILSENTYRGSA